MKLFSKSMAALVGALALSFSWNANANIVDLTPGAGSSGTINGAKYSWFPELNQPFGSGFVDPFVRIGGPDSVVQGYNTNATPYNTDSTNTFNRTIQLKDVGFIDNGSGQMVMRFLLDINQNSGGDGSLFSLDEVQLYISKTPNQSIAPDVVTGSDLVGLGALVYRMDTGVLPTDLTDYYVKMDYDNNKGGSGFGDLILDIPQQMFIDAFGDLADWDTATEREDAWLYLYSRFGQNFANNDGYEEWTYIQGTTEFPCIGAECVCPPGTVGVPPNCDTPEQEIPEPGILALFGTGLIGVAVLRRRRQR